MGPDISPTSTGRTSKPRKPGGKPPKTDKPSKPGKSNTVKPDKPGKHRGSSTTTSPASYEYGGSNEGQEEDDDTGRRGASPEAGWQARMSTDNYRSDICWETMIGQVRLLFLIIAQMSPHAFVEIVLHSG